MTVCLKMGSTYENIGSGTYTKAIFSTICVRLEHGMWGSRFPVIMNQLYHDVVPVSLLSSAVQELDTIIREFSGLKPSDVVWDLYERDAVPTWGRDIRDDITSVLDYFVTDIGASALRAMLRLFIHAVCGNESVTLDDTRFLGDSVPPIVVGKGKGAADDSIRLRSGVVGRTLINNHMIAALPSSALSSGFKVFQNILWKQCGAFDVIIALRYVGLNGNRIEEDEVSQGLVELNEIVRQLRYFEAADIVWDYEDRKKKSTATYRKRISGLRLDECFITVRKENLLSVMVDACEYAIAIHRAVEIDKLDYSFWAGN